MKSALILTSIDLNIEDRNLIRTAKFFKLALNHHARELLPNARIFTDYVNFPYVLKEFPTDLIITVRSFPRNKTKNIIIPKNIQFKGSTMVAAVEFLQNNGVNRVLIVGDNTVHSKSFQDDVKNQLDCIKKTAEIYQFSNGNFNLPVKSIKEFLWNIY